MKALALLLLLAVPASAADAPVDGKAAFARLKDLAGTWSGHIVKPDGPPGTVRYEVASGGTIVDPATDGHVHGGTIRVAGDELHNEWLFFKDGEQAAAHRFFLKRQ